MLSDEFIRKHRCSVLVMYVHTHYWVCSEHMLSHRHLRLFDCQIRNIRERKTIPGCSHQIPYIYLYSVGIPVDLKYRYWENDRGDDEAKRCDHYHHHFGFQVRGRAERKTEVMPGQGHQNEN